MFVAILRVKATFLKYGGTNSSCRGYEIAVIYRFAVVQSRARMFPLEMYPAFRLGDFTKHALCRLRANKGNACISKSKIGTYLFFFFLFCMKKNIIRSR